MLIQSIKSISSKGLSLNAIQGFFKKILWEKDIRFNKKTNKAYLVFLISAFAYFLEMSVHHNGSGLISIFEQTKLLIFYGTDKVSLEKIESSFIVNLLLIAAIFRIVFGICMGSLDILLHKKITGKPFDYEGMITVSLVNGIYLLTAIFTLTNPWFESLLDYYIAFVQSIPTLFYLDGWLALIAACLMADFCYYWSHRWSHKVRLFWCLGHVSHHRTQNLTQLTQSVDPQSSILDVAGGRAFVLLLMPIITQLMSFDITQSGWGLIVLLIFDAWTNPSHSIVLHQAETKWAFLRWFRTIFVTPAVHYTHHSREKAHNKCFGCNFGARFTFWDRLFDTYVEPETYIPKTGLFGESDYIRNPVRYVFHPFHRMYLELKLNKLGDWPKILFAKTTYHPPVRIKQKY